MKIVKNFMFGFVGLTISLFTLSACNSTVEGAGKDMEKAGESIQRSAQP